MNPRTAKMIGIIATFVGVVVVGSRSIKAGGAFDAKGVLGVTVWGATATLLAGFAPEVGAALGAFLAADVLVLPTGAGKASAADLLGSLITGGKGPAAGAQVPLSPYAIGPGVPGAGYATSAPTVPHYPVPGVGVVP